MTQKTLVAQNGDRAKLFDRAPKYVAAARMILYREALVEEAP